DPASDPILIENAPGSGDAPTPGAGAHVRRELGLSSDAPMIVYTGTFEAYQGLDLLLAAMAQLIRTRGDARLVLAGGHADQIEAVRRLAADLGVGAHVIF